MKTSVRALVALILACTVGSLMGSTTAIGFAATQGSFKVNAQQAQGTATLFDGTVIETGSTPSQIQLENGTQIRLATDSRAKVYESRVVLEKGSGQLESSSNYPIESHNLRVFSTAPDTIARVRIGDEGKVLVATVRGSVRVTNNAGLAVANLTSGLSMAFDPQAGASAPARLAGCLYQHDGSEYIFDAATKAAHGLKGADLARQTGKNMEITGIENPPTHVMAVTGWKPLPGGQCAKFAKVAQESGVEAAVKTVGVAGGAAIAGAAAAGAAAGAGIGAAATVAVVGGVAAATTVGGLAASGTFSGSNTHTNTNPPTSR